MLSGAATLDFKNQPIIFRKASLGLSPSSYRVEAETQSVMRTDSEVQAGINVCDGSSRDQQPHTHTPVPARQQSLAGRDSCTRSRKLLFVASSHVSTLSLPVEEAHLPVPAGGATREKGGTSGNTVLGAGVFPGPPSGHVQLVLVNNSNNVVRVIEQYLL